MDKEEIVYRRPTLRRFGSFQDLTRFGADEGTDMLTINGPITSCTDGATDPFACRGS